jgi:hypothetical protein
MLGVAKAQPPTSSDDVAEKAHTGSSRRAVGAGLAVAAWFSCRFVIGVAYGPARNIFSKNFPLWVRSDSANYIQISKYGQSFGVCGSPGFPQNAITLWVHAKWCGTALWMPGYPFLGRLVHQLGLSTIDALLFLSWASMAALLFLVWWGWCRELGLLRSYLVLLAVGLFPGAVYDYAVFPISLTLLCITGAVLAVTRHRYLLGMALMVVAGLCYPVAWFAAAGLAVGMVVVDRPVAWRETARRGLYGLGGVVIPILVVCVGDQIAFGYWNAYFLESGVGSMASSFDPFSRLWGVLISRNTIEQHFLGHHYAKVLAVQAALVLVLIAAAIVAAAFMWIKRNVDAATFYPAMIALFVLASIISSDAVSGWNRSIALAAPSVLFLRKRPIPYLIVTVVLISIVSAVIAVPFFEKKMV